MKSYDPKDIRNICLLSHGGVGKTSLLEAACYTSKATSKLGRVDNKTSIFDTRADEKDRSMTISTKVGTFEWKGAKVNMIDTPGFLDFLGDAKAALRAVESAAILVNAVTGPEVGTELVSRLVDESKAPRLFFMNGIDHDNVDFDRTVQKLKDTFGGSIAPVQIPIGTGAGCRGVVDLIEKTAYEYEPGGSGMGKKIEMPAEMADDVETARGALMESIAESDENLMNKYFEDGELSTEDLRSGLAKGVAEGLVFPVFCGSATQNLGVDLFLNAIVNICPSPLARAEAVALQGDGTEVGWKCGASEPTAAFVFKTLSEEHVGELNIVRVFSGKLVTGTEVANSTRGTTERLGGMYYLRGHDKIDTNEIGTGDIGGILKMKDTHTNDTLGDKSVRIRFPKTDFGTPLVSTAISAKEKGDDDKVSMGLAKLHEEDPTFTYEFHSDIHQSILSAMGDIHLDVILQGLKNRFKVDVVRSEPKISYRETVTKPVKYVEYTHKKQTGGAGQYARVFIDLEPLPRGGGYEFQDKIVGGVIDQSLRPSVDKGIRSKMEEGIIAGFPIVDVKVSLVDGKTHPVDSKDIAFQIAGREVFKKAFEMAAPILLEPVAELSVTVPDEYTGDVMGDLSSRRGKIGGMEPQGNYQTIHAKVPESMVQNYSQSLRAMTQGRGFFRKKFSHYDPVPAELTKSISESLRAAESHG